MSKKLSITRITKDTVEDIILLLLNKFNVEFNGCCSGDAGNSSMCYATDGLSWKDLTSPCWTMCPFGAPLNKKTLNKLLKHLDENEINTLNELIKTFNESDTPLDELHKYMLLPNELDDNTINENNIKKESMLAINKLIDNSIQPPLKIANLQYSNNEDVFLYKIENNKYIIAYYDTNDREYLSIGSDYSGDETRQYYYDEICDKLSKTDEDGLPYELYWQNCIEDVIYFKSSDDAITCFNEYFAN